jgi:hypothetical protein
VKTERAQSLVTSAKRMAILCAVIAVIHLVGSWVIAEEGTYYRVGFYGWLILCSIEANFVALLKALRNDVE